MSINTIDQSNLSKSITTQSIDTIFDDIALKFFYNLPDSELQSWDRILYQLQQAYWYYHDNYMSYYSNVPQLRELKFIHRFFKYSKLLSSQLHGISDIYSSFKQYINSIPVCGSILLNSTYTHTVLVQSYYAQTWGFPRGKLDENETDIQCCIRETYEEIGIDISQSINQYNYIDVVTQGKHIKLFIIENIDMEQCKFITHTKYEISDIKWIPIKELPSKSNTHGINYKYGNVLIFGIRLREWLNNNNKLVDYSNSNNTSQTRRSHSQSSHSNTITTSIKQPSNSTTNQAKSQTSSNNHRSHSSQRQQQSIKPQLDQRDVDTFGTIDSTGWSAEQMFQLNETKFGLKSTVPIDHIDYTQYDDIITNVLGNKSNNSRHNKSSNTKHVQNQISTNNTPINHNNTAIKHKKSQKKSSNKLNQPLINSDNDELDFSHNAAYTVHSYTNTIQQPTTGNTTTVVTTPIIQRNDITTITNRVQPNNNTTISNNNINEFTFDTDSLFKSLSVA